MKKYIKYAIFFLLLPSIIIMAILGGNTDRAYASTSSDKVAKTYDKFLINKEYESYYSDTTPEMDWDGNYYFTLLDIDQNGIPELLVSQETEFSNVYLFTYNNKKIENIGRIYKYGALNYNPKTKTLSSYDERPGSASTTTAIYAYKDKISTLMFIAYSWHYDKNNDIVYDYYINDNNATKDKYDESYNKYTGNEITFVELNPTYQELLLYHTATIYLTKGLKNNINLNNGFAKKIAWKNSNNSVISVGKDGNITGKENGESTISATVKYSNKTDKYTLTIKVFDLGSYLYGKWKVYEDESYYNTSITSERFKNEAYTITNVYIDHNKNILFEYKLLGNEYKDIIVKCTLYYSYKNSESHYSTIIATPYFNQYPGESWRYVKLN